jgi:hypothetical protein
VTVFRKCEEAFMGTCRKTITSLYESLVPIQPVQDVLPHKIIRWDMSGFEHLMTLA